MYKHKKLKQKTQLSLDFKIEFLLSKTNYCQTRNFTLSGKVFQVALIVESYSVFPRWKITGFEQKNTERPF